MLALVGEPGIGKTALLEYAAEQAGGMAVLRARGIESEAEIPFAGLAELLRPALGMLDRIPGPQATALGGALALGPPSARDRFAIGAATLSLLSAYAEEAPLALLVDDAHLLDGSSAEALLFAARRLVADPIALVLTVREGEPSLLDGADLRTLRVPGLDRVRRGRAPRRGCRGETAERLYRATGGNPLALLELGSDRRPTRAGCPAMGLCRSRRGSCAAFAAALRRCSARRHGACWCSWPRATRGELGAARRELPRSSVSASTTSSRAEEAGLVRLDGVAARFVHPLARSALYARASAPERRAAHAALAAALPDRDVDRRAWHLAAASAAPNREASVALEQAGARARARSAYAVAAAAFERAGRLAPGHEAARRAACSPLRRPHGSLAM